MKGSYCGRADPLLPVRVGGVSGKNLKMFQELCGDGRLQNVRIVTTNWDRVSIEEGKNREELLAGPNGVFPNLIAAGAKMRRQDNGETSARMIIRELISRTPVLMKITEEMNSGKNLGETSAGSIVAGEIVRLQKKHAEEMAELNEDMARAAALKNDELRAELMAELKALEKRMERTAKNERTLQETKIKELEEKLRQEREKSAKRVEEIERMFMLGTQQKMREADTRATEGSGRKSEVTCEDHEREAGRQPNKETRFTLPNRDKSKTYPRIPERETGPEPGGMMALLINAAVVAGMEIGARKFFGY